MKFFFEKIHRKTIFPLFHSIVREMAPRPACACIEERRKTMPPPASRESDDATGAPRSIEPIDRKRSSARHKLPLDVCRHGPVDPPTTQRCATPSSINQQLGCGRASMLSPTRGHPSPATSLATPRTATVGARPSAARPGG